MITYQDIHWESVNYLKNHLYRRLASPLNSALGRLAIAEHVANQPDTQEQMTRIEHGLELTLNLVKAWAALAHVKSGGTIRNYRRRQIAPDGLPPWLLAYLKAHTALRVEQTRPLYVHPETFYEGLIMMCQIGSAVGNLKAIILSDSAGEREGVWARAVFEPPQTPYSSLKGLAQSLNADNPLDLDTVIQLNVIRDFFKINGARFSLQNNTQSGEQALAALLPVSNEDSESVTVPVDEALLPAETKSDMYALAKDLCEELSEVKPKNEREAALIALAQELCGDSPAEAPKEAAPQPHLAGSVLAPTPRDETLPASEAPASHNALDLIRHTISGPVLAPTPRPHAAESKPAQPPETPDSLPATSPLGKPIVIDKMDKASETLIVPPPDFRRRLITPTEKKPDSSDAKTD